MSEGRGDLETIWALSNCRIHFNSRLQNILLPLPHEKRQSIIIRPKNNPAPFRKQEHIALLSLDLLARLVLDVYIYTISTSDGDTIGNTYKSVPPK
jgi:hypothetical protein